MSMIFTRTTEKTISLDWNSIKLLLLLTLPAAVMAIVLFIWPDVSWIAQVPFTVIGILGAFTEMLLSVFLVARYNSKPGILFISIGLLSMAVIQGTHSILSPDSSVFVWLHSLAGISGSFFFSMYVMTRLNIVSRRYLTMMNKNPKKVLFGSIVVSAVVTGLILGFSDHMPLLLENGYFTTLAWVMNSIPIMLYLFSGVSMFIMYRNTGSRELFILTAIVIFLFQASEVIYLARFWSVIWWFWLSLRLIVYLSVLWYVLKEYIQISSSLADEIKERKQIESALRKSEENWRNSFNSLEEVMMVIGCDYTIENINTSGLTLFSGRKKDIVGKNVFDVMPQTSGEYCPLKKSFDSGKTEHIECFVDEYAKHFRMKSSPIMDEKGCISKCVFLMDDVTEQVQAKAKEKLLQKELNLTSRLASIGEVAAGITHEINNPLTSIMAFAQILSTKDLPDDAKEAIDVINDSSIRIANIVEKLLAFARRHKPEKEYIDINSVITSMVGMRSYEMKSNNIRLITDLSTSLPKTMANVGEMQQVILNIVINAEQAITGARVKEGEILIESRKSNDRIKLTISDNGPGISEENADKLFDPFFTTKDESGGTGLGLSISYGIIQEHGGKIYTREDNDRGAVFVIELPIISEEQLSEYTVPEPNDEPADISKSRILVVDDEIHICRALGTLLTREGHVVETIRAADKALEKIRNNDYDLVLFDIKMPGMDGIELYQRMKELQPSIVNKVICITGDMISPKNKEFIEMTDVPCITKPFGIDELVRLVKEVIGGIKENAKIAYTHRR